MALQQNQDEVVSPIDLTTCDHTFKFNAGVAANGDVFMQFAVTLGNEVINPYVSKPNMRRAPAANRTSEARNRLRNRNMSPEVCITMALNEEGRRLGVGKVYHNVLESRDQRQEGPTNRHHRGLRHTCQLLYVKAVWSEWEKQFFDNASPLERIAFFAADSQLAPHDVIMPMEAHYRMDRSESRFFRHTSVRKESNPMNLLMLIYDGRPHVAWLADWPRQSTKKEPNLNRDTLPMGRQDWLESVRLKDNAAVIQRLKDLWINHKAGQLLFYQQVLDAQLVSFNEAREED